MSTTASPGYQRGTWRLRDPQATLAWIRPKLAACGITRCADVTHLDPIGIPVCCAIRPTAAVLQVSNGKGLTHTAAQVSALMEAVEFFHAENPAPGRLERRTLAQVRAGAQAWLEPAALHGAHAPQYLGEHRPFEWATGHDLHTGEPVQVPASAIHFHRTPSLHRTTTNGLASGNQPVEATLHALFELIERDAAAHLRSQPQLPIREQCQVVDLATLDDPDLQELAQRIEAAQSRLVLMQVPSRVAVHTFWAVLLTEQSWIAGSSFNTGWGTHVDARVAASRAVTEAIQSRVTMVHGAREDAQIKPVFRSAQEIWSSKAFQFFWTLAPNARWQDIAPAAPQQAGWSLEQVLGWLLQQLQAAGVDRVVACDLSHADIGVPVVKVLAPQLGLRHG